MMILAQQVGFQMFISSPYLITSYPLTRNIINAAQRGVEVNLIVPGIPDKKVEQAKKYAVQNEMNKKTIEIVNNKNKESKNTNTESMGRDM